MRKHQKFYNEKVKAPPRPSKSPLLAFLVCVSLPLLHLMSCLKAQRFVLPRLKYVVNFPSDLGLLVSLLVRKFTVVDPVSWKDPGRN